mmetsp:Transcript_6927/g.19681  ORF Transcript_6927/g.19681 Transcript_6927/m.19681 type:complete len:320 (-) Transcript_6927:44-1003(-)
MPAAHAVAAFVATLPRTTPARLKDVFHELPVAVPAMPTAALEPLLVHEGLLLVAVLDVLNIATILHKTRAATVAHAAVHIYVAPWLLDLFLVNTVSTSRRWLFKAAWLIPVFAEVRVVVVLLRLGPAAVPAAVHASILHALTLVINTSVLARASASLLVCECRRRGVHAIDDVARRMPPRPLSLEQAFARVVALFNGAPPGPAAVAPLPAALVILALGMSTSGVTRATSTLAILLIHGCRLLGVRGIAEVARGMPPRPPSPLAGCTQPAPWPRAESTRLPARPAGATARPPPRGRGPSRRTSTSACAVAAIWRPRRARA